MFAAYTDEDRTAAVQDAIEAVMPHWYEAEQAGVRFLSERDFPIAEVEDAEVSEADWEAFFEMTFVDPAERAV